MVGWKEVYGESAIERVAQFDGSALGMKKGKSIINSLTPHSEKQSPPNTLHNLLQTLYVERKKNIVVIAASLPDSKTSKLVT